MKLNLVLAMAALPVLSYAAKDDSPKPNVIFILADDLGIGDLSCYGQQRFSTPNIDRLAEEGMRFTQHISGTTVSAPSRCVLMTGFHTGHSYIRDNRDNGCDEGQFPICDEAYTLPEMFKSNGYVTGGFGKWGLGMPNDEGSATKQGFDTFWGYYCQALAHRYYPEYIWHNDKKVYLKGNDTKNKAVYAPDVIHEKALDFIKSNRKKPFFAYVPLIQPHAELMAHDDEILESMKGKFTEEKPWVSPHPGSNYGDEDFQYHRYSSQAEPRTHFAAMVKRIDRYVGEIMDLVEELGIADNTIIIFSSDNGAHIEGGADVDYFNSNGLYRGNKRDMYDGGIHVPMLMRWPKHIEAGVVNDHISAFWDFMPTLREVCGDQGKGATDGISMVPTMLGNDQAQEQHEYLYWEIEAAWMRGRRAIRMGDWKCVQYNVLSKDDVGKIEVFNVTVDPSETTNLADTHQHIVAKAAEIFKSARTSSNEFPFIDGDIRY